MSHLREAIIKELGDQLNCAYDCIRVWEAWSVGTMREDDLLPLDDRLGEIADGIIHAIETTPEMQRGIWAETAMDNLPSLRRGFGQPDMKAYDKWYIDRWRPVQAFPTLNAVFAAQHQDEQNYHGA